MNVYCLEWYDMIFSLWRKKEYKTCSRCLHLIRLLIIDNILAKVLMWEWRSKIKNFVKGLWHLGPKWSLESGPDLTNSLIAFWVKILFLVRFVVEFRFWIWHWWKINSGFLELFQGLWRLKFDILRKNIFNTIVYTTTMIRLEVYKAFEILWSNNNKYEIYTPFWQLDLWTRIDIFLFAIPKSIFLW